MEARRKSDQHQDGVHGRRANPEDRRGIPRFTDGELISLMQSELKLLRVFAVMSVLFALFELGYSLKDGLEWMTRGLFFLTVFVMLAVLTFRRISMVRLYLENNSVNNLRRSQESQNALLIYVSTILALTMIASIFYRL